MRNFVVCVHTLKCLQVNDTVLENVTHEEAVSALKATQTNVILTVVKLVYPQSTPLGTPHKVSGDTIALN